MNAQNYSAGAADSLPIEVTNKSAPNKLMLPSFLVSEFGILLVSLGGWIALNPPTQAFLLVCGGILSFFGIVLFPVWIVYQMKSIPSCDRDLSGRIAAVSGSRG